MKPREEPRTPLGRRLLSLAVFVVAGFMIATGAVNARGGDLRPNRNTDLAGLIASESKRNAELAERVAVLRRDVDLALVGLELETHGASMFEDQLAECRHQGGWDLQGQDGWERNSSRALSATLEIDPRAAEARSPQRQGLGSGGPTAPSALGPAKQSSHRHAVRTARRGAAGPHAPGRLL